MEPVGKKTTEWNLKDLKCPTEVGIKFVVALYDVALGALKMFKQPIFNVYCSFKNGVVHSI